MGIFEEVEIEEREVRIEPGDFLLLFTDGVTEATNQKWELFGIERLQAMLVDHSGSTAEEIAESILQEIETFVDGAPIADDMTFVVLRRSTGQQIA